MALQKDSSSRVASQVSGTQTECPPQGKLDQPGEYRHTNLKDTRFFGQHSSNFVNFMQNIRFAWWMTMGLTLMPLGVASRCLKTAQSGEPFVMTPGTTMLLRE